MAEGHELARLAYEQTEDFPNSETFGLRMQIRRSAVSVASHIAEAHGRLNDTEMRKGLGSGRAALNEFETQTELAKSLGFFKPVLLIPCWSFHRKSGN